MKQASLALGATHIQTILKLYPAAKSGIVTAIVLGGAIGEQWQSASCRCHFPCLNLCFLTTAVVSEMSYAADTHKSPVYHWLSTFPIYYYHKSSFESDYEGGKKNGKSK